MQLSELILIETKLPTPDEMSSRYYGAWVSADGEYIPVPHNHEETISDNPARFGFSLDELFIPNTGRLNWDHIYRNGWVRIMYGGYDLAISGAREHIKQVWNFLGSRIIKASTIGYANRIIIGIRIDGREDDHEFEMPVQRRELIQFMNSL